MIDIVHESYVAWPLASGHTEQRSEEAALNLQIEGGAASDSLVFSVGSGGITSSFIAVRESQGFEE